MIAFKFLKFLKIPCGCPSIFLFQCRYRAGIQNPVEGVRTIFDFMYWRHNVLNAHFLEPVSEEDIELYCQYMEEFDYSHQPMGFLEDWQDFEAIRDAYQDEEEAGRNLPEWYRFYFSRTGRGAELLLPDVKKEKDVFYFLKGNEERIRLLKEAEKEAAAEDAVAPEKGDYFNEYTGNNLARFMNLFEDKANREMHEVYEHWRNFNEKEEMLREDLDMLFYTEENVPIKANDDWIEAVHLSGHYRTKKITENIYAAFDEYKMNLGLGIRFPEKEDSCNESDFYNNLVLLGRKLNGEKEDFDY